MSKLQSELKATGRVATIFRQRLPMESSGSESTLAGEFIWVKDASNAMIAYGARLWASGDEPRVMREVYLDPEHIMELHDGLGALTQSVSEGRHMFHTTVEARYSLSQELTLGVTFNSRNDKVEVTLGDARPEFGLNPLTVQYESLYQLKCAIEKARDFVKGIEQEATAAKN